MDDTNDAKAKPTAPAVSRRKCLRKAMTTVGAAAAESVLKHL